jgi:hypothetical protein
MSKTDKTDPPWVKALRRNSPEITEYHDHRAGVCDIDEIEEEGNRVFYWQRYRHCGLAVSYYGWHNGFYSRPPRGKHIRNLMEGSHRAKWRDSARNALKMSREDMEDADFPIFHHRHAALWEMY